MIGFLLRAGSTLEITNGEQRALRKISRHLESLFIKTLFFAQSNLADTFKTGQLLQLIANEN